jgi:hypothetical protein
MEASMDPQRNDLLGELASDAALERSDFLAVAGEQLQKFMDANRKRIGEMGGIVLIDEDPDYLAVAPDLTFRSRSRYQDAETGEWISETEVIESAPELVELYNPADLFQWFAEAAREAAGLAPEPTGAEDVLEAANVSSEDAPALDVERGYAEAADQWAARQPGQVETEDEAAGALYDLAVDFLERSQQTEAGLLAKYEDMAEHISPKLGDLIIVDDDDERLILTASGSFRAEVIPEGAEGEWKMLTTPEELVEFYDPTDVFGDLADALAEGFPGIDQPAGAAEAAGDEGSGDEGSGDELDEEPEKS